MRPDQVSTALTAPPEVPLRAERWNLRPWSSRRRCMMPAPNAAWLPPPWQAIATRGRCAFLLFWAKAEASSSIYPGGPLLLIRIEDSIFCASFVIISVARTGHMNVSVGERWEGFIERVVRAGRYGSSSEVVREGLRLVEEREAKLLALRQTLNASIEAGGVVSEAEIDAALAAKSAELEAQGYSA